MSSAVSIVDISKAYRGLQALNHVTLQIEQGEFFGLLGPNGAGKTTLISCLSGLARPDAGKIQIMGFDVQSQYQQARRSLGVVPE